MPFLAPSLRIRRASTFVLGLAALLGSCDAPVERPQAPVVSQLGGDAGSGACTRPEEGCPCQPGDLPVECIVDQPVTVNGRVLCQHGTRVCREGAWSACEDITLFAPSGNKILGSAGAVSVCRPDEFTQTSTPDATDLTPTNSTNLDYSTTTPTGLILVTIPPGNVVNFGLGNDTDGDGVPDSVDDCPADNTRWRAPCAPAAFTEQGFFHILPPGASATDPMTVNLTVKTVDAYLLVDTTASMSGEIANLRTGITGLMASIQSTIPGANLGLGMYRETAVSLDSQTNDFPFMHLLDPTSSLSLAQSITNQVLDVEGNSFWPEAGAQAIYAIASGRGIGPWVGNRDACPNGGFGWPCFRPGTVPVLIVVGDAPWWNGPSFATTDPLRNRPELSHEPYPGTRGTLNVGSRSIPRATVVSSTGQTIISNDALTTAFQIGDVTDRSLTIHGANNGATTRLVNDFTEACSSRTPSGPDVFYTFTIDQPRHFIFEAFGDFDPILYLRRVNSSTASTMACDLDSASVADGNGNLVWRTGAKIDTRTIPGAGATTTNVALTGCNASASDVPTPMTGCSVATSTTNAALANCTVPSQTFTSNFSGCAVDSTTSTSTFTGCSVPATTTAAVSGCSFENSAASLTGCAFPSTTATTSTGLSGCTIGGTATLSGCAFPPASTTDIPLTCGSPSLTTQADLANCSRAYTNDGALTGCTISSTTRTTSLNSCKVLSTVSLSGCWWTTGGGWDRRFIYGCDAWNVLPGDPVPAGNGIPSGTTVDHIDYSYGSSNPRIYLSQNVTSGYGPTNVTIDTVNRLYDCQITSGSLEVGMTLSGNTSRISAGSTVTDFWGSGSSGDPYIVFLSTPPSGANGDAAGTGSPAIVSGSITGPDLTRFTNCSGAGTSLLANGRRLFGTDLPSGVTVSSATPTGSTYTVVLSSPALSSAATLTGVSNGNRSTTVWENCTIGSGDSLAVGQVLSGNRVASGTTIASVTGSGSGPYTIVTSTGYTGSSGWPTLTSAGAYGDFTCTYRGSAAPAVGDSVTGGSGYPSGAGVSSIGSASNYRCYNSAGTSYTTDFGGTSRCDRNADGSCTCYGSVSGFNGGYWTAESAIGISPAPSSSSATLTQVSRTTPDLTRMTGCVVTGDIPSAGNTWSLGGTNLSGTPTISTITATGSPSGSTYTIVFNTAQNANTTITSASRIAGRDLTKFVNCSVTSGANPANGMTISAGTATGTIGSPTQRVDGTWIIPLNTSASSAAATLTQVSTSTTTYDYTQVQNCTLQGGTTTPPAAGMTLTGTNLGANSPAATIGTVTTSMVSGTTYYAFPINNSTLGATSTVTGGTAPDLTHVVGCTVTGMVPAMGDSLVGTGWNAGGTVASATPSGATYRINFSAGAAMSSSSSLTGLSRATPQLNVLTGCALSMLSATPATGMTLAGTNIPGGTTISNATLSGGLYTITMSQNATTTGSTGTVTATSTGYTMNRLVGCALASGSSTPMANMVLTGTGIAPGTTITGFTPTGGSTYALTLSANATSTSATAGTGTITVDYLNRLDNCTLSSGMLSNGMGLTGSLLAAGTTIGSFSGTGTGPYTINLDRNATAAGATTASGTLVTPLPQLTGCQGSFLLLDSIGIQGPGVPAGTTITTFGGLGTAGNPWVIDLSAAPTSVSTNTTFNAMMPGASNQLTGCMISSGGPLIDATGVPPGMAMSGALIAPGSTLSLAVGSGSGPYTLTLSDPLTGTGATDASGTITQGASGGASPLAAGTYQLVVDSTTQNAASASSPGRGTFQLRVTNLQQQQSTSTPYDVAATQAMEVPWATTAAALRSAGIKTIGVASCPAGCTDLAARQTAYATCVQGATPTTTTGADNTTLTSTYCGAAYNRCIALFGAAQSARCTTVFDQCRQAEISAGQQNLTVRTQACNAAQTTCNQQFTSSTTNCGSVYTYCRNASAVCTTQASSVSTCLSASASGSSDAATYCDETIYDMSQMGVATGSVRADGTPFVYQIAEDGSGLSATIADGVRELARYILFDVTARCEDPLGTGACTALFSNAAIGTPSPVGQTPGCASCTGATCLQCTPGANLPYQINFLNSGVAQTSVAQTFDFYIVLRDASGAEMSRAPVRIVVPPANPTTVAPTGSFRQIYDGTYDSANNTGCPYPGRRAKWGNFTYTATVPAGTSIVFSFKTAETIAGLASASSATVTVTASATDAVIDIDALLTASGLATSQYLPYLQVTSTLNANASATVSPVLQTYNLEYACVDAE